jgi:cold shock CspA family protein
MARSKETFNKKEQVKKKLQKRKEKAERREARKAGNARTFEDMLAYTDENGNIVSSPPDPAKKKVVNEKDMVIGARNSGPDIQTNTVREGRVTFFNDKKGYGFIEDSETGESIFVHYNDMTEQIGENDKVTFEVARGPRGLNAVNVALVK